MIRILRTEISCANAIYLPQIEPFQRYVSDRSFDAYQRPKLRKNEATLNLLWGVKELLPTREETYFYNNLLTSPIAWFNTII